MKRKITALALCILMLAQIFPTMALAADVVASGSCGAEGNEGGVTWELTGDGTFIIRGNGELCLQRPQ